MQHRVTEESVSGEMFSTAVKLARHRGLLEPTIDDGIVDRRAELVGELDGLQRSVSELAALSGGFWLGARDHPIG